MSEGEIKKRMRKVLPWHYKENSKEICDCQLKPLWDILDDAAKEFPVDDMPNSTPDHEMLLRLVKLNRERLNWRLRWLGASK